jgi:hypothetical protein
MDPDKVSPPEISSLSVVPVPHASDTGGPEHHSHGRPAPLGSCTNSPRVHPITSRLWCAMWCAPWYRLPPLLAPPGDSLATLVVEMGLGRGYSGRPTFAAVTRTPLSRPARVPKIPLPPPSFATSLPHCFRCLDLDHCVADYKDPVRCRGCGRSGHRYPDCPRCLRRATSIPELPLRGASRHWSTPRPPTPYPHGVVPCGFPLLRKPIAARRAAWFPTPFSSLPPAGSAGAVPATPLSPIPSDAGFPASTGAPGSPSAASVASSATSTRSNSGTGARDIFMPPVDWAALNRFAYSFVSPNASDPSAVVRRAMLLGDIPLCRI